MATFPPPPCCVCRIKSLYSNNSIDAFYYKVTQSTSEMHCLNMECVFPEVLLKFINYINSNLDMDIKIPLAYVDKPQDIVKESNIKGSIFKMLKQAYKENPHISVDEIKEIKDIDSILTDHLDKIKQNFFKYAENPLHIWNGKATYQRFFIESLLFAGKLASKYFDAYKHEKNSIFKKIIDGLDIFFVDQNLYKWIKHDARVLEPFGKYKYYNNVSVSDDSSLSEEDELDKEMI